MGDMRDESDKMLALAAIAVETAVWDAAVTDAEEEEGLAALSALMYAGKSGEYRFVVTSFLIEDQGFPPGTRGYDGLLHVSSTIVRLPRQLAKRAVELAERAERAVG